MVVVWLGLAIGGLGYTGHNLYHLYIQTPKTWFWFLMLAVWTVGIAVITLVCLIQGTALLEQLLGG